MWPTQSKNSRNSTKFADKDIVTCTINEPIFPLEFNWREFFGIEQRECARFYDQSSGRFLQIDPEPGNGHDPLSVINRYIYARNFPTVFTDRTGMDFWHDLFIGALGVTAVLITGGLIGGLGWGAVTGALSAVGSALTGSALISGGGALAMCAATGRWDKFGDYFASFLRITATVSLGYLAVGGVIGSFEGGLTHIGGNGIIGYAGWSGSGGYGWMTQGASAIGYGNIPLVHETTHALINMGVQIVTSQAMHAGENVDDASKASWSVYEFLGFLGSPFFYGSPGLGHNFPLEPN